jgi:hypothetical protein
MRNEKAILLAIALCAISDGLLCQQTNCPGKNCTPGVESGWTAPPGFTITPLTPEPGKGNAHEVEGELVPDCEDCKPCKRAIDWSFDGSAYSIRHGDDWVSSGGPAQGRVTLKTHCDDDADTVSFLAAGGEALLSLTCECQ